MLCVTLVGWLVPTVHQLPTAVDFTGEPALIRQRDHNFFFVFLIFFLLLCVFVLKRLCFILPPWWAGSGQLDTGEPLLMRQQPSPPPPVNPTQISQFVLKRKRMVIGHVGERWK